MLQANCFGPAEQWEPQAQRRQGGEVEPSLGGRVGLGERKGHSWQEEQLRPRTGGGKQDDPSHEGQERRPLPFQRPLITTSLILFSSFLSSRGARRGSFTPTKASPFPQCKTGIKTSGTAGCHGSGMEFGRHCWALTHGGGEQGEERAGESWVGPGESESKRGAGRSQDGPSPCAGGRTEAQERNWGFNQTSLRWGDQ